MDEFADLLRTARRVSPRDALACVGLAASCWITGSLAPSVAFAQPASTTTAVSIDTEASAVAADSIRHLAVRAALDSFITDFNNLDSSRFSARWSDDASAILPFSDTPTRLQGRAAIITRFMRYFDQMRRERSGPPYLHMVLSDVHVDLLGESHALVSYAFPGGGRPQRRTLVMRKENPGGWRILHLHGSSHP
jgi:ketosteroid isomerase-like protein